MALPCQTNNPWYAYSTGNARGYTTLRSMPNPLSNMGTQVWPNGVVYFEWIYTRNDLKFRSTQTVVVAVGYAQEILWPAVYAGLYELTNYSSTSYWNYLGYAGGCREQADPYYIYYYGWVGTRNANNYRDSNTNKNLANSLIVNYVNGNRLSEFTNGLQTLLNSNLNNFTSTYTNSGDDTYYIKTNFTKGDGNVVNYESFMILFYIIPIIYLIILLNSQYHMVLITLY